MDPRKQQGSHKFARAPHFAGPVTEVATVFDDSTIRFNDGACDPAGNLLAGTMAYDGAQARGTMYQLAPNGAATRIFDGVTVSNGLCWTPDRSRAYYVDTPTQRIDVFDWTVRSGLHNRRPFVSIPSAHGQPDGLTVDSDGGVWLALWGGGAVHRYLPSGLLDVVVAVPVPNVTACTFGGSDFDELYITTSRYGDAQSPPPEGAGAVFRARPRVRGMAPLAFGA